MTTTKECSQYKIICSEKLYFVPGCICKNWFGRIVNSNNSTLIPTDNICWLNHKLLARRQQLFEKYAQLSTTTEMAEKNTTTETFILVSSSLASDQLRLGYQIFNIPH